MELMEREIDNSCGPTVLLDSGLILIRPVGAASIASWVLHRPSQRCLDLGFGILLTWDLFCKKLHLKFQPLLKGEGSETLAGGW